MNSGDKLRKDGGNEASRLPHADCTDRLLVATGSKPPLQLCLHSVLAHAESKRLNSPNFAPMPTSVTLVHHGGIGATAIVKFGPTEKLNLVVDYNGLVHFVSGV